MNVEISQTALIIQGLPEGINYWTVIFFLCFLCKTIWGKMTLDGQLKLHSYIRHKIIKQISLSKSVFYSLFLLDPCLALLFVCSVSHVCVRALKYALTVECLFECGFIWQEQHSTDQQMETEKQRNLIMKVVFILC